MVSPIHHDAADPRIVGVGAVILDIPGLVAELFEADEVMHRLPGNAGERHLADEMEEEDLAAAAHGIRGMRSDPPITAQPGENFRAAAGAPTDPPASRTCPCGDRRARRAAAPGT